MWVHDDTLAEFAIGGDTITTTYEHEFWNHTDQQWQGAADFDFSDSVLMAVANQLLTGGLLPHT